ncbi:MAG: hypothetical protein UY12_C0036G0003 [Parcubacteria group bacterium GW2011_GWA2_47_8b]|uniref:Uncharacterized protein n=1 Tax=Candidatus Giovannonibacteria bacterium GW2011_GWB1_47_6b TaxID=1618655 RepID=A0A0G1T5X4_9BACT|nr:MAG: hypothetical protein UY02_C0006G0014 [Candidatus Giovannonibacteria bacterium GW2011_GWB1_47_6b]KKU83452.1 MAG: hypothetical protein UY12_C0036G0003 [Parcubacteria group bacterium GW2011_GWA2_47_8b]KKU93689.1 MAG: hypothetical protein UY24_C0021G0003 [Parcubacteria group bacterium GW2011_GWA1_48_11b]
MGGGADDISHEKSEWRNPNGNRNVAYLNRWGGGRGLDLDWCGSGSGWRDDYRFLAVRGS